MDTSRQIKKILKAEYGKPFEFLGPHEDKGKVLIRAFLPEAREAFVVREGMSGAKESSAGGIQPEEVLPMHKIHKEGFFEAGSVPQSPSLTGSGCRPLLVRRGNSMTLIHFSRC